MENRTIHKATMALSNLIGHKAELNIPLTADIALAMLANYTHIADTTSDDFERTTANEIASRLIAGFPGATRPALRQLRKGGSTP